MFRKIEDFQADWKNETQTTLRVLRALTDESLGQAVVPGKQTLGGLAWHLVLAAGGMPAAAGVSVDGVPGREDPAPASADEIAQAYERAAAAAGTAVAAGWTDEMLAETVPLFGMQLPRGVILSLLIKHQAHHRGQMTVLMRQAGLRVPGCYGPSEEETAEMMAAAAK